jgi:diaminopimelate epimerase
MQGVRFVKGHGTGNDFVVLPDPDGDLDLTPALVRALCDRRTGVGADGVLRVVLTAASGCAADARWFMDYRNADGSVAQMCGNGIRVFGRYLVDAGYAPAGRLDVATRSGVRTVEVPASGAVTVDMGPPVVDGGPPVAVTTGGRTWFAAAVSMGNPHAVCLLDGPAPLDVLAALDLTVAPTVAAGAFPDGVNVEFVARRDPATGGGLVMRVHERGVGETASCGTGACAVAVAAAVRAGRRPTAGEPVETDVDLPGGRLSVVWTPATVLLRGPAVLVSDGVLRDGWRDGCAGAGTH